MSITGRDIVGREKEQELFQQILNSPRSEFIAVYGRRRVGKTFLINKFFTKKGKFIEVIGQKKSPVRSDLEKFHQVITEAFRPDIHFPKLKSWKNAFDVLNKCIGKEKKRKKIILFFDELPWLAKPKSLFIQELEYYWNKYWSKKNNLTLIVCGSTASWMLEKLIYAKGGLHNRLTHTIHLKPFNLKETTKLLKSLKIKFSDSDLLELYMIMGGIPYYLTQLKKSKSIRQNINALCFNAEGFLYKEFDRLFASLFNQHELHEKIVRAIAKKRYGIGRNALLKETKLKSGGTFNKRIQELESAGFIEKFVPWQNKRKEHYYKISDEYVFFYLRWIEPLKASKLSPESNYWLIKSKESAWNIWAGYSFEALCWKHLPEIIMALNLEAVALEAGTWKSLSDTKNTMKGTQIDLILNRSDSAVTICEIKFSKNKVNFNKEFALELKHKIEVFSQNFPKVKNIFCAVISPYGISKSIWTEDLLDNEVIFNKLIK